MTLLSRQCSSRVSENRQDIQLDLKVVLIAKHAMETTNALLKMHAIDYDEHIVANLAKE